MDANIYAMQTNTFIPSKFHHTQLLHVKRSRLFSFQINTWMLYDIRSFTAFLKNSCRPTVIFFRPSSQQIKLNKLQVDSITTARKINCNRYACFRIHRCFPRTRLFWATTKSFDVIYIGLCFLGNSASPLSPVKFCIPAIWYTRNQHHPVSRSVDPVDSRHELARLSFVSKKKIIRICYLVTYNFCFIFVFSVTHSLALALRDKFSWIPRWSISLVFQTPGGIFFRRFQVKQRTYLQIGDSPLFDSKISSNRHVPFAQEI